jgi:hypothetical protein
MSLSKRCLAWLGMTVAVAGLAGCPIAVLRVEPLSKTFGETSTSDSFRIMNAGSGQLTWTVSETIPWLRLSVDGGATLADTLTGNTRGEVDVIGMYVDRSLLPSGTSTGEIRVVSNSGSEMVRVSATRRPPARLEVSETTVAFGATAEQLALTLTNSGVTAVNWQRTVSANAPWLTATPAQGSLPSQGSTATVTLTVNRTGLSAGTYSGQVSFTSNAGDVAVSVTMAVPSFSVTPLEAPFGTLLAPATQQISVRNRRFEALALTLTPTANPPSWLQVAVAAVSIPAGQTLDVALTADPTGRTPGTYTGSLRIAATATGEEQTVSVSMVVPGLAVSPESIDFGSISEAASTGLELRNLGAQPIAWQIVVPAASSRWLSVDRTTGTVQNVANVVVTANPAQVEPGDYTAVLAITSDGGDRNVTVRMTRPRPSALKVEPSTPDFGSTRLEQLVAIWNDGSGTVNWRIDTTGFPAWLSLSPVNAQGIASGAVSGAETDTVTLFVDRAQAAGAQGNYTHQFVVEASGDADEDVPITVRMNVPLIPQLKVVAEGIDAANVDFINFDIREDSQTFIIRNEGNGPLDWSITLTGAPRWIASVNPSQGTLPPRNQTTITVTVDRSSLDYRGAQFTLPILSNDPARPTVPLLVEVQVAKKVIVRASPEQMGFGDNQVAAILSVANFGDPDTELNFKVTSTKEWLSVFPDSGKSYGTILPTKDWRDLSVSVDRSQLEGRGASAKITVFATRIENNVVVPDTSITPVEVTVTVDALALTIEAARPALRVPSLARYVLLLRNIQYQSIALPDALLDDIAPQVRLFEDDVPVTVSESSQFMTPGRRTRGSALILLDYSGSMQEAAGKVTDPAVSGALDPIQALYEATVTHLIDGMPDNYRVALGVFSERGASGIRMIQDASGEPLFTKDKAALQSRLRNTGVLDNGATQLFEAFFAGANTLLAEDGDYIPFDSADDHVLIVVTDGRVTTPPGEISPYILFLEDVRVRPFVIGWGINTAADPLIRLSKTPGGHYYATRTVDTGGVDTGGNPVRIPQVSELLNWCVTEADPCDQSVTKDLASQVAFSYVTLNETDGVSTEGRLSFNDPTDQNSPCLADQGEIAGSFLHTQLAFFVYSGDPRLGQISLHTEGIRPDGSVEVVIRADYMPRNIAQLSFDIATVGGSPGMTMEVTPVTPIDGGLIADWVRSGVGSTYTYTAPGAPLRYGEFGDLLRLRFSGAGQPFDLRFDVLFPQLTTHPDSKYFTHPDSVHIEEARFLASSAPYPKIETDPALNADGILELGAGTDIVDIELSNIGGSHEPTGVGLYWEAALTEGADFLALEDVPGDAEDRIIYSTLAPYTIHLVVDRCVEPGFYRGTIEFFFDSVFHNQITRTLTVFAEVLPPALTVSTASLNFSPAVVEQTFTIENSGQGGMLWFIDVATLPGWLFLSDTSGALCGGETDIIRAAVTIGEVPPGSPVAVFEVTSPSTETTRSITVIVTLP